VSCVAGTFPQPGWVVIGWVVGKDGDISDMANDTYHFELIDPTSKKVLASFKPEFEPNFDTSTDSVSAAVDLDGDGIDEIVSDSAEFRSDIEMSTATFYSVKRKKISVLGSLSTGYEGEKAGRQCEVKYRFVGGEDESKVVVGSDSCESKKVSYALKGSKLVKLKSK
jgi:hypothetical protein